MSEMAKNDLHVLFAAFEAAPFYKKGGLGDVMGALPKALQEAGVSCRLVIPFYRQIRKTFHPKKIGELTFRFGNEDRQIKIYEDVIPQSNIQVYLLENQRYINLTTERVRRIEQFAFFDLAVCSLIVFLIEQNIWTPTVVHLNDWHTALVPLLLQNKFHLAIPTVLTIHNLMYQQRGSLRLLDLLGVKDKEARELRRQKAATEINILGEGILHASKVTTVSPSYASEISHDHSKNPIVTYLNRRKNEFGKEGKVIGILNGIDTTIWSPEIDQNLAKKYDRHTVTEGKLANKTALLSKLLLQNRPTIAFIGRMAWQKGIDLVASVIDDLVLLNCNFIFLGQGHYAIEKKVRKFEDKHRDSVRALVTYSEDLAHELYAGSDFLLMPSHYEPCGLVQMVGMRYGTIPIAACTGGLIDSIKDGQTGFLFKAGSTKDLLHAVKRALDMYKDKQRFDHMIANAMAEDFSWDKSAKQYRDLYIDILRDSST